MKINFLHIIFFISAMGLHSCIESFDPEIEESVSKTIVIDAILTTEPGSCKVEIKYLEPYENGKAFGEEATAVSSAMVLINDSEGNITIMEETSAGIYHPVDPDFHGKKGVKYQLSIDLEEGKHYESEPVVMPAVNEIDSIYAVTEKRNVIGINGDERLMEGMQVYVDTRSEKEKTSWFQYDYTETWKQENWGGIWHEIYLEQKNKGIYPPSLFPEWPYDTLLPELCFRTYHPNRYLNIAVSKTENNGMLKSKPVVFIPFNNPRLKEKYSVLVKQYSLNYDAFEYWRNVELQAEYTGSFYDPLPSRIYSNIYNPEDNSDAVAGFFFVKNVSSKRLFISKDEIPVIPVYPTGCTEYEIWADNPWGHGKDMGWPDLFNDNSPCCFDCRLCSDMSDEVPEFWIE